MYKRQLVIRDSVNGLIVPESDPAALAGAILRLAALPPDQRRSLGAEGRRLVETEFGWPHLARRYLEHFARLAQFITSPSLR